MKLNERAPDFTLKDADGSDWKLSDKLGKTVVLLFYPGDNTPVCTKQLCSVRDNWEIYAATGAEVVGISTDSAASHKNFAKKHDLPLTLLADENGTVARTYNAASWLPNRSARAVVVIDKDGVIRHHKVQPVSLFRPKDDEVLEAIRKAKED
ncbi:MAG: peroxiredoxin [Acidobacteriota bacterium]|nr:peroxiredoxin [Acidobacteriota bacterium]